MESFFNFKNYIDERIRQIRDSYKEAGNCYAENEKYKALDKFLQRMYKASYPFQIFVEFKNMKTGSFYNKIFSSKSLNPKRKTTAPLTFILFSLLGDESIELYFSPNHYKYSSNQTRAKENVIGSNFIFLDVDDKNFEELTKTPIFDKIEPSYIVSSGHGFHLYFEIENTSLEVGSKERKNYFETMQELRYLYNSDPRACELARILRVPFSYNRKSLPKEVLILSDNENKKSLLQLQGEIFLYKDLYDVEEQSIVLPEGFEDPEEIEVFLDELPFNIESFEKDIFGIPVISQKPLKITAPVIKKEQFKFTDSEFELKEYSKDSSFPNNYLIQDMLYALRNRNYRVCGFRKSFLFVMYFALVKYENYSETNAKEKLLELNSMFEVPISTSEFESYFRYLTSYTLFTGIKNTTVKSMLSYKEEEIKLMRGIYTESSFEKRDIYLSKERKRKEGKYKPKKPSRSTIIEAIKNNPDKTHKELSDLLEVSTKTIQRIKKDILKHV